VLAQPGASRLAVIGTGTQAWTQVWAIRVVRDLDQVLVYSRDPANRAAFAARARDRLGVPATEAQSARDAVRDATIVVLATSSGSPVISPDWLSPGCHVTTLGPKVTGRAEFSPDLADRAAVIATDSLAQVHAYQPPFILAGTPHLGRMVSLGSIIMRTHPGRGGPDDITLFCSAGLAGTEVHLLAALADSVDEPPITAAGQPLTRENEDALIAGAEAGFDPATLIRRQEGTPGRPEPR
jgi:ornithine cyclodeaminase/alanine dehydrogenase-like protein (mu-crystallin family)